MSDSVILIVADDNYIDHAHALMVGCRKEGEWNGDFCIIMPDGCDDSSFLKRGVSVLHVPDTGFMAKFWIFSNYFQRWESVFYLDCDMLIQGPIKRAFDQLERTEAEIICHQEDTPAITSWYTWDKDHNEHQDLYDEIRAEFPWVEERIWNTAWVLFKPAAIEAELVGKLRALQKRFAICNPEGEGGTDQQIIDLLLHKRITQVQDKLFCYWGADEPQSRVMSKFRGWTGDEIPIMLHYCRWYAPWVRKEEVADAYLIRRLKKPCFDLYHENLAAFAATFPLTPLPHNED